MAEKGDDRVGILDNKPLSLYCDNKATINIAHNPELHDRIKHVEVDKHFIKEKLIDGQLSTFKSKHQLLDVLTKVLVVIFHSTLCKMGMRDIHPPF